MVQFAVTLCFDWFKADMILVGNHDENKSSSASKVQSGFLPADQAQLSSWGIECVADHSYYYLKRAKSKS